MLINCQNVRNLEGIKHYAKISTLQVFRKKFAEWLFANWPITKIPVQRFLSYFNPITSWVFRIPIPVGDGTKTPYRWQRCLITPLHSWSPLLVFSLFEILIIPEQIYPSTTTFELMKKAAPTLPTPSTAQHYWAEIVTREEKRHIFDLRFSSVQR